MINPEQLGRQIAEDILKEASSDVGPCFYPGKFKPPHKGHFEAAKYLASKPYINKVYVIISNVTKYGITAEDSFQIWKQYLNAEPNPKISVSISKESTPIKDVFSFMAENPDIDPIYVAGAAEEVEGIGYFDSIQKRFPNKVRKEIIPDQFERISSTQMRSYIKDGNYEEFEKFIPDAAYNKGVTKDVFGRLLKIMK
jgi:nicotinic acid mononucleotide adenylyltransferase